jgi:hypothetical protein
LHLLAEERALEEEVLSVTITTVTPRIKRYWLSKKIGLTLNPGKEKKLGRVCGRGPYAARTPFSNRMEAPIVLMITG